jgi:hypothetical protein
MHKLMFENGKKEFRKNHPSLKKGKSILSSMIEQIEIGLQKNEYGAICFDAAKLIF